jgi:hypothetical protein
VKKVKDRKLKRRAEINTLFIKVNKAGVKRLTLAFRHLAHRTGLLGELIKIETQRGEKK